MALSALVTVTDGANAGQALSASSSNASVTKSGTFVVALTTTTGVLSWRCYPAAQSTLLDWNGAAGWYIQSSGNVNGSVFQMNLVAPKIPAGIPMLSEVSDGQNVTKFSFMLNVGDGKSVAAPHLVRAAIVAAMPTYTKANGVMTASATGGLPSATSDGLTLVAGDRFLLPPGIAASTLDAGLWYVTIAGATGVTAIYTRPADWSTAATIYSGNRVDVTEGTLFLGTSWKVTTAGSIVVDTNGVEIYPAVVSQRVTLVSGAVNVTNVPILSASKTGFTFVTTTATGITLTVQYGISAGPTIGDLGTASVTLIARIAAGTVNANDTSVGTFTVINQI